MSYSVRQVADFFITLANKDEIDGVSEKITHLKLQKILYFAQSAFLALDKGALFDEKIEAWQYGPVIPEIYTIYRTKTDLLSLDDRSVSDFSNILPEHKSLLEEIWAEFGKYSAKKLVSITHEHAPWKNVYIDGVSNIEITKESLKDYYSGMFSVS